MSNDTDARPIGDKPPAGTVLARFLETPSAWILIGSNLFPVWGVLFDQWSLFGVVFLFWTENLIIGAFNVLKMLSCGLLPDAPKPMRRGGPVPLRRGLLGYYHAPAPSRFAIVLTRLMRIVGTLYTACFFSLHYGLFCCMHGVFVLALLGDGENPFLRLWRELSGGESQRAILALIVSHGYSFVTNFIQHGEYKQVSADSLFTAPYGRIGILHVAISVGAVVILAMGSGIGILLVLVGGKIVLDVYLHLKELQHGALKRRALPQPPRGTAGAGGPAE